MCPFFYILFWISRNGHAVTFQRWDGKKKPHLQHQKAKALWKRQEGDINANPVIGKLQNLGRSVRRDLTVKPPGSSVEKNKAVLCGRAAAGLYLASRSFGIQRQPKHTWWGRQWAFYRYNRAIGIVKILYANLHNSQRPDNGHPSHT